MSFDWFNAHEKALNGRGPPFVQCVADIDIRV